jgi:hypothetical protein
MRVTAQAVVEPDAGVRRDARPSGGATRPLRQEAEAPVTGRRRYRDR